MPVSRFCQLTGIPRRTHHRWQANARRTGRAKGPWPAPVVDQAEALVAKYAADWPAWGHRKIYGLMRADGHRLSPSSVERATRRRGLLQPIDYQGERRELAKVRSAAFAEPPTGPNQVWQLDFSEYETTIGGIWRGAEVRFYRTSRALAHLAGGHADRTWSKWLAELVTPAVLILDDFAMRELTAQQADDLYELVSEPPRPDDR